MQAIAAAVGYRSVGHFNELFRSYHGMTPGDYRKLSRTAK
ncbi:helix-turn-helix domain-containing protein [Paratractidigestivibacter sp.]